MKKTLILDVTRDFVSHFARCGYMYHEPEPLIPNNDKTLAFTNATIVPLKKYLLGGFTSPGYVVVQPCLRLRNLANNSFDGQFTSFFRMASILAHSAIPYADLQNAISIYITTTLGFHEIELHYNADTEHLAAKWDRAVFNPLCNKHERQFYTWTYGISNLHGRGVTLCVNTQHGVRELGNIVEILDGGRVVAYEFGFGIESYLCIRESLPDNYAVIGDHSPDRKLHDLTLTAGVVHQAMKESVHPLPGTTASSVKKLTHELAYHLYETDEKNIEYFKEIDWEYAGVLPEAVHICTDAIRQKLLAIKTSERMLSQYRAYTERMMALGRDALWKEKKLSQYIRRNNLQRVAQHQTPYL